MVSLMKHVKLHFSSTAFESSLMNCSVNVD
uniref:Uncharacterized protein n=1 Tax=Arundo donax TaxID=35708 RepID=A0A0A9C015_ARUDO